MNIMIVGCGKVGSRLACELSRMGHDVVVVDQNADHFETLDSDFTGFTVAGVPIDQDVLKKAGIEGCDAFAAVTQDDNVNIMVSQLAREIFKIPTVIARIYDPQREDVFSHFGLHTICPTNLTVSAVCGALNGYLDIRQMTFGTTTISYSTIKVPKSYVGKPVSSIPCDDAEQLFAIQHEDNAVTLNKDGSYRLKATDLLIFSQVVD